MIYVIGVIIGLIFVALFVWYAIDKRKERQASKKRAMHYFDSLSKVIGKPFPQFVLSKEDRSYLKECNYNPAAIYRLVSLIMIHINAPCTSFNITIKNADGSRIAGEYKKEGNLPTISLLMKPEYTGEQIIAIVCHECMHHYLGLKKIVGKDARVNELLTDYAAVYTGFGKILWMGYAPVEYGDKKVKIGYISDDDVWTARKCLKSYF